MGGPEDQLSLLPGLGVRQTRIVASLLMVVFGAVVLSLAGPARADLGHDVASLSAAWKHEGVVVRLAPRLYERDDPRHVALPERALRLGDGCTTVAILGVTASSFLVRLDQSGRPDSESPISSRAGLVEITRCEKGRKALRGLVVELRSPRAVLEVLVLVSPGPPGEAYRVLPQRLPGPSADPVDPGRAPAPSDIVGAAKATVARSKQRGAEQVDHGLLEGDVDGSGVVGVELAAGCHELTVMGIPAPRDAPRSVDIDVDLVWPSGEIAASDRTNAPDAAVRLCVGRTRRLGLHFAGALPGSPVLFVHARWALPAGLDARWSPEVRAGIAEALREHHLDVPASGLVEQSLGIAGLTGIPVDVEPGACYVVAITTYRGRTDAIAIAAAAGEWRVQNHGGPDGTNTAIAFCSGAERTALVEVEATGSAGLAWHLAMWQSGRVRPGELAR